MNCGAAEPSTTISRRITATAMTVAWNLSTTARHHGMRQRAATEVGSGPKCRAGRHSDTSRDKSGTLVRLRSRTTTQTLLEGAACASSARRALCALFLSPVRHSAHSARTTACTCSGAKDAAASRALIATTPRPTIGAAAARTLTRNDTANGCPPCTKSDSAWFFGEVVVEREVGGETGHPHLPVDGASRPRATVQWRWRDDAHWTFGTLTVLLFPDTRDRKRASVTKMSCTLS